MNDSTTPTKTCIKCGETKPDTDYYHKSGSPPGVTVNTCISCFKQASKARYHATVEASAARAKAYREKNRDVLRAKQNAERAKSRERLSKFKTPCVLCGESWMGAVAFHHKNPIEKSFTLSQRIKYRDDALIQAEAAKCICLCFNCHQKFHTGHRATVDAVKSIIGGATA